MFDLLSAAGDRRRAGRFPINDIQALTAAIDALPQNATTAGAKNEIQT